MMVLDTNLDFLATGSPSTSSGDLELVLLLLSIFFNFDFEAIDTRILDFVKQIQKYTQLIAKLVWNLSFNPSPIIEQILQ